MKLSKRAAKYLRPPGPTPRRERRRHVAAAKVPSSARSCLIGNLLVACGCPLAERPHTRDEHALAVLRRDLPDVFPS